MRRSWAYVLMIVATVAGGSALLLPTPAPIAVEEAVKPSRPTPPPAQPRPEPAAGPREKKPRQPAAAATPPAPKPEPPSVAKRVPPQNTAMKRLAPPPRPGAEPGPIVKPGASAPGPAGGDKPER